MTAQLLPELVMSPSPSADEAFSDVLDILADAIADQLLARTRAEIAQERGIDVDTQVLVPDALPRDLADWHCVLNETRGRRS